MALYPRLLAGVSAALLLAGASPAQALQCSGMVQRYVVYASGTVSAQFSWRNDYTHLCSLEKTRKGVSPMACVSWLALVKGAAEKQSTLTASYGDSTATCETLPTQADAPAPTYLTPAP